jgi:hypothetical protein
MKIAFICANCNKAHYNDKNVKYISNELFVCEDVFNCKNRFLTQNRGKKIKDFLK